MEDKEPMYSMGVIGSSGKENEGRVAIHPDHLKLIPPACRSKIYFEKGYGEKFGVSDQRIALHSAGLKTRKNLFKDCDIVLLCKPCESDYPYFKQNQILWGWPHCVQSSSMTELAVNKELTLIAFENMFMWSGGRKGIHILQKNNELAGYSSVNHSLHLLGCTGHYGQKKRCGVLSFGSTARGAIHALKGLGFGDITVLTRRPEYGLTGVIPGINYKKLVTDPQNDNRLLISNVDGSMKELLEELKEFDVIVNCMLQDTDHPYMYIVKEEVEHLKEGTLIIDISCDETLGFDFAKPTHFFAPTFKVGSKKHVTYYSVDHSPTYFYDSASYEISIALLDFIPVVMGGKGKWQANTVIKNSIDILNGKINNQKIITFQNRQKDLPYAKL